MPRHNPHAMPNARRWLLNTPIHRGSTVAFSSVEEFDRARHEHGTKGALIYGTMGTPTTFALEDLLAEMEGGYGGLAVSSGLAAVTTALLAFVGAGDHLLMTDAVYWPTRKFCDGMLRRMGVETTYYDPQIGAGIAALLRPNTRCIFMESPASLTFEVQDAAAIAAVATAKNITTILDNTWGSAYFFKPLQHGVNVSVIAGTKYLLGYGDALLGLMVADAAHYSALRACRTALGQCASPEDIYLALRGAKTLSVRLEHHQRSAMAIARWLQNHPDVIRVLYPPLPSAPGNDLWRRDFTGAASLFSIEVARRSPAALAAFLDGLAIFSIGASWGGCDSLALPAEPKAWRTATPWTSDAQLIRLHIGLENVDELKKDLAAGLSRYRNHA